MKAPHRSSAASRLLRCRSAAVVAATFLVAGPAGAQEAGSQLPITVDADYVDIDGKTSMLVYRGLRLTQGNIAIQADRGRASNLEFGDSVWHLEGNVVIDTGSGHLESESADLTFGEHRLRTAVVTGSPATFRLQRPGSEAVTYAEAGKLVYDFPKGIVEFSGKATISEGGNRISSEYLVYNIEEQRIKAQSGSEADSKVKITYTPEDPAGATPEDDSSDDSGEDQGTDEAGGR